MRTQFLAVLVLTGCEIIVNKGDDDDNDDDDDDNKGNNKGDDDDTEGCPPRRPWSCDGGCFQWLIEIEGETYCLNDECDGNSDCGAGEVCCSLDALVGVPYLECVSEDANYYTASGYYYFSCD